MRKTLGYIPVEQDEVIADVKKETDVKHIDGQWFKLAEVFLPGVPKNDNERINNLVTKEPDEEFDEEGRLIAVQTKCGRITMDYSKDEPKTIKQKV
jgi:hypothetical protein